MRLIVVHGLGHQTEQGHLLLQCMAEIESGPLIKPLHALSHSSAGCIDLRHGERLLNLITIVVQWSQWHSE